MFLFLDYLLSFGHFLVIAINLFGWIWSETRTLHMWVFGMTVISWLVLGLRYGLGYCFLTDWQWDIKRTLGEHDLPSSFIHYWVQKAGWDIQPFTTDIVTGLIFLILVVISVYVHVISPHKKARAKVNS